MSAMFEEFRDGPRWEISPADLRFVASAYGWTIPEQPIAPFEGAVNGVARIATSIGDVVVRVHRPWTTPRRLEAVHAIQDRLRVRGVPVPHVHRASDGRTWAGILGVPGAAPPLSYDRLVEVSEYIPSDPDRYSRARAERTLGVLPALHAALATVDLPLPEPDYSAHADASMARAMLDETDGAFARCRGHAGFDAAAGVRRRTRAVVERIGDIRAGASLRLPRQIVHGDLKYGNVLTRGEDVVGIIDFDFMAVRTRIFDLAYALYHCLTLLRMERDVGGPDEDEGDWLVGRVAAYAARTHRPLTGDELGALPHEMALVGLYQAVEAGYVADEPLRAIAQTLFIARHLGFIEWLVVNAVPLRDRFGAAIA